MLNHGFLTQFCWYYRLFCGLCGSLFGDRQGFDEREVGLFLSCYGDVVGDCVNPVQFTSLEMYFSASKVSFASFYVRNVLYE